MDRQPGVEQGMRILSYLVAGVLVYGGVGWLIDRWLNTNFALAAGIIFGAGVGIYMVYRRYGRAT